MYTSDQSVTITCATAGTTIYYTTDGTAPTAASPIYSTPIAVAGDGTTKTIKAFAVKAAMADSTVASATYTISYLPPVATPTFSPAGATYTSDQAVTISCATAGATIHYTTDGTTPTAASPAYSSPVLVWGQGTTVTIKAIGVKAGSADSPVASATYTISDPRAVFWRNPDSTGAVLRSSWVSPDSSASDRYAYDSFVLAADASIAEVRWRGGYLYGAAHVPASDFWITFFASIAGDTQPLCENPAAGDTIHLAHYAVGGNAGESVYGTVGGTTLYNYSFTLPTPFAATAGVKYWIRIVALQSPYSDWGIASGTREDGQHYAFDYGISSFHWYPGDTSFVLLQ
jgi:hypothetical protein